MSNTLRGRAAVVGIGQLPWYKRGTAPEPEGKLALRAVVAAADDAGLDVRDIDGFTSWGSERNFGRHMAVALGLHEVRYGALVWTHGGGSAGAVGLAAMAIATGQANAVVVIRAMAETGASTRLSNVVFQGAEPPFARAHGIGIAPQGFAMRTTRQLEHDGFPASAMEAIVEASYYHASRNPGAYAHGLEFTRELYLASRSPAEPLHVYDNSRENDGAIALLVVSAERAADLRHKPAYVLSSAMGRLGGDDVAHGEAPDGRNTAGFRSVARHVWRESGYGPSDVDNAQLYTNVSSAAVLALIDHGFCTWDNVAEFATVENLTAPDGGLPINTAGGDLADGFLHGAGNASEGVRQIRGESANQVPNAKLSLIAGGPHDFMVSSTLFGSEETL
jgi:acetyl-CoA acetyltransferase